MSYFTNSDEAADSLAISNIWRIIVFRKTERGPYMTAVTQDIPSESDLLNAAYRVKTLLLESEKNFSAAESCTGGLIAKTITDVPGASSVFVGGVVSYTNGIKSSVLGVPNAILDEFSAVSEQTARAMAEGVQRITGSDFALSVTGVAGPDRDDRGNDVGTVFIGLSNGKKTIVDALSLGDGRDGVRRRAALYALEMLYTHLNGL